MSTTVLEQTRGDRQQLLLCKLQAASCRTTSLTGICAAGAHEELEHLERLIVKDFRNELKGHKERLHQNHRVRARLDAMQEQAKKLVSLAEHPLASMILPCSAELSHTRGLATDVCVCVCVPYPTLCCRLRSIVTRTRLARKTLPP